MLHHNITLARYEKVMIDTNKLSIARQICLKPLHTTSIQSHLLQISLTKQYEPNREKTGFCICENKGADQLCSNCTDDQRLCFRYMDSTLPLLLQSKNVKLLACFCYCTDRFVSDLFGNHIVGFPTRRLKYV